MIARRTVNTIIDIFAFIPRQPTYYTETLYTHRVGVIPVFVSGPNRDINQIDPNVKTIVFFHGNADSLESSVIMTAHLQTCGYKFNVVGVEYPGYPSYGYPNTWPTTQRCVDDGLSVIAWLSEQHSIKSHDIILMGQSLGTGVAAEIAAKLHEPAGGLVLVSPYRSLISVVSVKLARLLWWGDQLVTEDAILKARCPILIAHGEDDRLISVSHGIHLADISDSEKLIFANIGHNNILSPLKLTFTIENMRKKFGENVAEINPD